MEGYKRKIEWYKDRACLSQVFDNGLEFAFVTKDYKQLCPFVTCRDFLQDAIHGHIHQKKTSIYGFCYDPSKHYPIYLNRLRLIVANSSDAKLGKKIPACLEFVHQVEKALTIARTMVRGCHNPPKKYKRSGVFLFEGSRRWLISPPMISLYTLLIRVGMNHKPQTPFRETIDKIIKGEMTSYQAEDRDRLRQSIVGVDRIIRLGDRKVFPRKLEVNYPKQASTSTIHNNLGICGFTNENMQDMVGVWYKEK